MDNARWQAVFDEKSNRIIGRLKRGTDLMNGMKEICAYYGVTAAQFQCLGSLECAKYVQVARGEQEGTIKYSPIKVTESPVELITGTGFIGVDDVTDDLEVHFHGMFVDCDRQVNGGHFIEGENITAITVEYIMHVVNGVNVRRRADETFKVPFFQFSLKEA